MHRPALDLSDILPILREELEPEDLRRVLKRMLQLADQRLAHQQELAELQAELEQ